MTAQRPTEESNPLYYCQKTENHMLKSGKKPRKTDLKNGQNRKTENPNAPLLMQAGEIVELHCSLA